MRASAAIALVALLALSAAQLSSATATPHYGWRAVNDRMFALIATAVPGGSYVEAFGTIHGDYHVCRVPHNGGYLVGKLMLPVALSPYACIAPSDDSSGAGKPIKLTSGYEVLVSANDGTAGWTDVAQGVPSAAIVGSSVSPSVTVGRAKEDSKNLVPGSVVSNSGGFMAAYADNGDTSLVSVAAGASSSAVEVLHDTGVCPYRQDKSEQAYKCVGHRTQPGPTCTHAKVIVRKLGDDHPAMAEANRRRASGEPNTLCVNHQAFVYFEDTEAWTSGVYGLSLKACASSVMCGVAAVCNDDVERYHLLTHADLCADEDPGIVGRNFTCAELAEAEAALAPQYDTCQYPTVQQYELTLGAHNCHSYVEDVVAEYDKRSAAKGRA